MRTHTPVAVAVGIIVVGALAAATGAGEGPGKATPPAKGPRITVEPASFDFGRVLPMSANQYLEKEFSIRNFGSEDLVIESVATTCGCTVAEGYAKTIKPGGSSPLKVKLRPNVPGGRFERAVLIKTNDPVNARVEVKLAATVTPPGS